MKSHALRLTLLTLFVGLIVGATYVIWDQEIKNSEAARHARVIEDGVRAVSRTLLDIRASQPGYIAAGQGDDFWAARVDTLFKSARQGLATLHGAAQTAPAIGEVESAAKTFEDFTQMDRRAREYVRNSQRLLASDLIFSDGIEKIDNALASLERARDAELTARDLGIRERRRTEIVAAAGAAGLGLLIVFALVPLPREQESARPSDTTDLPLRAEAGAKPRVDGRQSAVAPAPTPVAEPVAPAVVAQRPLPAAPAPPPQPLAVDLPGVAALCTELCRVVDTRAIPAVLERAASLLDASGIIVWIADPDGRELAPIIAHGYPQHLVTRLGMIARDAENVTAAAFRTGLVQTLNADDISPGAIAAPLITPSGAVGVMAAEILHDGERKDTTRAVAAIVAAQLAMLVGPPAPRAVGKSEAAGA